ncbi:hypothetical protein [Paractinoplanes rishiriensis]|uniref:hypothetical protein n=1 Tax=Paractinoplanes rishiriensis TaxID=1050105 RepID=UPI001941CF23|nr:hypothetical protein [Actinoplanes rishiriensis]
MTVTNPTRVGAHRLRRRRPAYVPVLAILAGWTVVLLTAPHLRTSDGVHRIALFVHLASLVLGFGAVLTLDWSGLMWILRHHDLFTLVRVAQVVHVPIWLGLGGLTLSGMLLGPDTGSPWTVLKLLAVLAVAINGLGAAVVQRRLLALDGRQPPAKLMLTAVLVATVSQAGWWTATVVGFLNAQR